MVSYVVPLANAGACTRIPMLVASDLGVLGVSNDGVEMTTGQIGIVTIARAAGPSVVPDAEKPALTATPGVVVVAHPIHSPRILRQFQASPTVRLQASRPRSPAKVPTIRKGELS